MFLAGSPEMVLVATFLYFVQNCHLLCNGSDVHASFDLLLVIKERFIQLMSFIVLFDKDVFVLWSHGEITCLVTSHHLYIVIVLCKASM